MTIINHAWVLPRPRRTNKYIGSFPLHFEKKLIRLLELNHSSILHPFGGRSECGLRIDIKKDVQPDIIADAHQLPIRDGCIDCIILDPPYNEAYSKRLYKTDKVYYKKYTVEAVRVLKEGGYLVMYHYIAFPSIKDTILVMRIFMETRIWHKLRCIHIHRKASDRWFKNTNIVNYCTFKRIVRNDIT